MTRIESATVCIPAHNEELCIAQTLDSINASINAAKGRAVDILVCANACTDRTIDRIIQWADQNNYEIKLIALENDNKINIPPLASPDRRRITVLETPTGGKPNACNILNRHAVGEVHIFADADIILHPDSIENLIASLERSPNAHAAAGILSAPKARSFDPILFRMSLKMKEFASKPAPFIHGPLYAIRELSAPEIPLGIIAEDVFLGMAIGVDKIVKVDNAIVYQIPPSTFGDYYKRKMRDKMADLQLKRLDGEKYRAFRHDTKDRRSKSERKSCLTMKERVIGNLISPLTLVLKVLDRLAKRRAHELFKQGKAGWITMGSTKKLQ